MSFSARVLTILFSAVVLPLVVVAQAQPWKLYDVWPFDAKEATRRQAETAQAIQQPIVLTTTLGERDAPTLNWRLIPAGKFTMGSPATEPGHEGDEGQHPETINEPFYMMETQLTVEQYRALMHADPPSMAKDAEANLPVAVLYRDAVDQVLPALAKLAPAGWKVILPDQARLQYAARAGVATMTPGGDTPESAADFAWTRENSGKEPHPVAQKQPNAWGLYDVIGNRWHWFWRAARRGATATSRRKTISSTAERTTRRAGAATGHASPTS